MHQWPESVRLPDPQEKSKILVSLIRITHVVRRSLRLRAPCNRYVSTCRGGPRSRLGSQSTLLRHHRHGLEPIERSIACRQPQERKPRLCFIGLGVGGLGILCFESVPTRLFFCWDTCQRRSFKVRRPASIVSERVPTSLAAFWLVGIVPIFHSLSFLLLLFYSLLESALEACCQLVWIFWVCVCRSTRSSVNLSSTPFFLFVTGICNFLCCV